MPISLTDLKDWTVSVDFEGIAWAVIDREGESMNALGRRPTVELGKIVTAVEDAPAGEVRGLVLMSGKEFELHRRRRHQRVRELRHRGQDQGRGQADA